MLDALEKTGLGYDTIDASGCIVLPGFIDPHQHILGAGGEAGPQTRMREIELRDIVRAGVTTVIGILGTDGTTRHLTSLLAKARAWRSADSPPGFIRATSRFPRPRLLGLCATMWW